MRGGVARDGYERFRLKWVKDGRKMPHGRGGHRVSQYRESVSFSVLTEGGRGEPIG